MTPDLWLADQMGAFAMAETLKLIDVIDRLASFDSAHTIYAREPWNEHSQAIVTESNDGDVPEDVARLGLDYFIEVDIAIEFLEGCHPTDGNAANARQKCARLIEYAINDA